MASSVTGTAARGKRSWIAARPAPSSTERPRMMSGVARSVLRSARPAVVVVMKVLSRPPIAVGEVKG